MYDTFGELKTDLYKLARTSSNNAIFGSTEVDRAINKALIKVYHQFPWPFRQDVVVIQTQAPYTTGTVNVTNGSRAVSGGSTSWNTGWTGMWLQVGSDSEWYQVKSISSTTALILEQPYVGTTNTTATYTLYKRQYRLPSVVDDPKDNLFCPANNEIITYKSKPAFDRIFTSHTQGSPCYFTRWGSFHGLTTYTTGTVAGSAGTKTLTGTTTSWLGNVLAGDEIEISSNKYNVLSVESDTSLTLCQNLLTSPSGTAYTVRVTNPVIIEFGYIPDQAYNIEIPFLRRGWKLLDSNDIFYIPTQHLEVVRKLVVAEILFAHDSGKYQEAVAEANGELQTLFTEFTFGIDSQISVERE